MHYDNFFAYRGELLMAQLRARKLKTGTFYYVIPKGGGSIACGRQRTVATEILAEADRVERLARIGLKPDPLGSNWTLKDLKANDLKYAAAREKEIPSRRRRWASLIRHFGETYSIEEISPDAIEDFIEKRRKSDGGGKRVGVATVNRDLSLLRVALARARRSKRSGYEGDPFRDFEPLKEKGARKVTPAMPWETCEALIAIAWALSEIGPTDGKPRHLYPAEWRQNAAIVELTYRTASRPSQIFALRRDQVEDGVLSFPAHKRGAPRAFALDDRLRRVLSAEHGDSEWVFPSARGDGHRVEFRHFWSLLRRRAKLPDATLRSLSKSASSALYNDGGGIPEIQQLLGHGSPEMAVRVYSEPRRRVMQPIGPFRSPAGEARLKRAE